LLLLVSFRLTHLSHSSVHSRNEYTLIVLEVSRHTARCISLVFFALYTGVWLWAKKAEISTAVYMGRTLRYDLD